VVRKDYCCAGFVATMSQKPPLWPGPILKAISMALKPGGRLVMSEPLHDKRAVGDTRRAGQGTLADAKVSFKRDATISPEMNVNPATIHNAPCKPSRSAVTPAITAPIA
jgi:hypothetical protein